MTKYTGSKTSIPDSNPDGSIRLNVDGARIRITLNNPQLHNRLSGQHIDFLLAVLQLVEADNNIRVAIITGVGKSFCSGFDLAQLGKIQESSQLHRFGDLTDTLEKLRCPTICALNGSVYGGGVDIALACDFRIMASNAKLAMPAAKFGLHYYPNGIRRYVVRLGIATAKKLLLSAATLQGEQLIECGFADQLVEIADLDTAVDSLVHSLQRNGPLAVEGMKSAINLYANSQVPDEDVYASFESVLASEDFKIGAEAAGAKVDSPEAKPAFKRK